MSADKRKKFHRACALLRELNTGPWKAPSIAGRGRWSLKNPTLRYIVERGMAKIVRITKDAPSNRRTIVDTGVAWARGRLR